MPEAAAARVREFHELEPLLPYSWPWLLVDRVLDWVPGKEITCVKAVSASDPVVAAHFAGGRRLVPGVVLVELVAQAAYLLHQLSAEAPATGEPSHVLARCQASFLAPASAGSVLVAHVSLRDTVRGAPVHEGVVTCDGQKVCQVQIISATRPTGTEQPA
jgi:3-hydroxyacyl-[acyl-carrier-protein] dehydratase